MTWPPLHSLRMTLWGSGNLLTRCITSATCTSRYEHCTRAALGAELKRQLLPSLIPLGMLLVCGAKLG